MDLEQVIKSTCCEQGVKDTKSQLEPFPGGLCPTQETCSSHKNLGGFFPNSEHFGPALKPLADHCRMAFRLFNAKNFSFVRYQNPFLSPSLVHTPGILQHFLCSPPDNNAAVEKGFASVPPIVLCRLGLCLRAGSRFPAATGRRILSPCGGFGWADPCQPPLP